MKKSLLLLCLCTLALMMTGCVENEPEAKKTVSEITEIPELIPWDYHEDHENCENDKESVNVTKEEPEKRSKEDVLTKEETAGLPSSYNYIEENRLPMIRNQGNTNTCWAFAALSALESSKDADVNEAYSADHLVHHNPFEREFEDGGAYTVTTAYLLAWEGPVTEEADPFDGESPEDLSACVHVQEVRQSEPKDYEAIKRFVYLYGGVETALYLDFDETMTESSYYNKETNAYCYLGEQPSNHDLIIVGWDDNYPAENFVGDVQQKGAFLCQNSWGENFGNEGIFYVSYEDVNIGGYGVAYSRIDSVDNYDRIYQADLCGYTAQIGYGEETAWFANVYSTEEEILVRAAGFYATGRNTSYKVYMVDQFNDEDSFKEKTFLCKGNLEDAGYYTIDFPEAVSVKPGEFAIVVEIVTEDAEYPVAIECPVDGLSENADFTDGKGYLSYQGNLWEHVEATKNYNICLKAYADIL